jgi:4-hydroxymandelate oxidase
MGGSTLSPDPPTMHRAAAAMAIRGMSGTKSPTGAAPDLRAVVNLSDFEALARARLPAQAIEYVAGGSGDELTLRRNRTAFDAISLLPRVLVDVSTVDSRVDLLGLSLPFPVLLAPAGFQLLLHPEGERASARAAGEAGTVLVASTVSTTRLEDIATAATGPLWFQLYVQRDRGYTRELVARVEAAGYRALLLTADAPVLGPRDREKRAGFALPPGVSLANLQPLLPSYGPDQHHDPNSIYNPFLDPSITWETFDWLRSQTRLPLGIKGVLAADDARLAVEHGAELIVVSNHGGRCLDSVPATIEALPAVVEAVAGRVPVLLDGGVRRGTDVVKALARGARAVLIGRPYLWALASMGESGVTRALQLLTMELHAAMALCGTPRIADIGRDLIWEG